MAMSQRAKERLINWKFRQAWLTLQEEENNLTPDEREVVHALAKLLGNAGWGMEGYLGVVIEYAVDKLVEGNDPVDGSS